MQPSFSANGKANSRGYVYRMNAYARFRPCFTKTVRRPTAATVQKRVDNVLAKVEARFGDWVRATVTATPDGPPQVAVRLDHDACKAWEPPIGRKRCYLGLPEN